MDFKIDWKLLLIKRGKIEVREIFEILNDFAIIAVEH